MSPPRKSNQKEIYRRLRTLPWDELWNREARRFDAAAQQDREKSIAVIRAVAVVFAESGDPEQAEEVKHWLAGLLRDPSERVRRYAIAALPKIGCGPGEEVELLSLLRTTAVDREKTFAAQALEKIGGAATLETIEAHNGELPAAAEQKVKAAIARRENPSAVRLNGVLSAFNGLTLHLRGRRGLENIVRDEAQEFISTNGKF